MIVLEMSQIWNPPGTHLKLIYISPPWKKVKLLDSTQLSVVFLFLSPKSKLTRHPPRRRFSPPSDASVTDRARSSWSSSQRCALSSSLEKEDYFLISVCLVGATMGSSSEIIDLSTSARRITVDNRISLKFYFRIADNILKQVLGTPPTLIFI